MEHGNATVAMAVVRAGMDVVRACQLDPKFLSAQVKPGDKTLITAVDRQSGEAMRGKLRVILPDALFNIEDVGQSGGTLSNHWLMDPIDGTRAFANGLPTSTVICAFFDSLRAQVTACAIGEPISGRYWVADGNGPCTAGVEQLERQVEVWKGPLSEQATVLVDVNHGFVRGERQIMTDGQVQRLLRVMSDSVKVLMPGSNGLNQALVANGGERLAGGITTAIGGPWDVCGVHLVLQAGGAARAFRVDSAGKLANVDPLNVLAYDLLVYGNSGETVNTLAKWLLDANGY